MNSTASRLTHEWTPLIARILLSALFLASGFNKLFDFSGTVGYLETSSLASFATLAAIGAIVAEIGGGALVLFGWKARLGANVLALYTVLTALVFHSNFTDQAQQIQFMKNLAIAGGLLYVAHFGAGPKSTDQRGKILHGDDSNPQTSAL
jgi:putative oxidoreductase